ncbi:MAG: ribonuclease Z, partial [Desulfohalobiaceae bacterium]|nr:ribonuclease Z [Desulfohalobiaceae bacterium]
SEDMARGCGVMVHEAYTVENRIPGHATVFECLDFARRTGARTLALVHLQRQERKSRGEELRKDLSEEEDIRVLLPEPGDVLGHP